MRLTLLALLAAAAALAGSAILSRLIRRRPEEALEADDEDGDWLLDGDTEIH